MTDTTPSLSFGQLADEYDRWRPGYPDAAVRWLAPAAPARVADVGAGTGKLTSCLLARGLTVEAVEPDARMLAVLARNNSAARCHESDSTAIPVEDQSLDAVLVADAWHWFDAEATISELHRVLKPGGWLGLVWNVEMRQFAWTWEITPEHRAASLATTSMLIAMAPEQRTERLQAARSDLQRVCDAAGTTSMLIRQEASCVRWTPLGCKVGDG